MVLALPPRSLSAPTMTPWEMRPSTMFGPSAPALKLIWPSCMTVVAVAKIGAQPDAALNPQCGTPEGIIVVRHARELVHGIDGEVIAPGAGGDHARRHVRRGSTGPWLGPGNRGQMFKNTVQVQCVGKCEAVRQQVQLEVGPRARTRYRRPSRAPRPSMAGQVPQACGRPSPLRLVRRRRGRWRSGPRPRDRAPSWLPTRRAASATFARKVVSERQGKPGIEYVAACVPGA